MRTYRIQFRDPRYGLLDHVLQASDYFTAKAVAESMFGNRVVNIIDITLG